MEEGKGKGMVMGKGIGKGSEETLMIYEGDCGWGT